MIWRRLTRTLCAVLILGLAAFGCAQDPATLERADSSPGPGSDLDTTRWRLVHNEKPSTDGQTSVPYESFIYPVDSDAPEFRLYRAGGYLGDWCVEPTGGSFLRCYQSRNQALDSMVAMANQGAYPSSSRRSSTTAVPVPASQRSGSSNATPTVPPTNTVTMGPTPTSFVLATPSFTRRPVKNSEPTSTLKGPLSRYIDERRTILNRINSHRRRLGYRPVSLGAQVWPQLHAEDALKNCYDGYWSPDGLSTYMQHSLEGGLNHLAPISFGVAYCSDRSDGIAPLGDPTDQLIKMVDTLARVPGSPIMESWYDIAQVGIAHNEYNLRVYLFMETDLVDYSVIPNIKDGVLALIGSTHADLRLKDPDELSIDLFYDPPPEPLAIGQLARSICNFAAHPIASLVPSRDVGVYQGTEPVRHTYTRCVLPTEIPADSLPPQSLDEAFRLQAVAKNSDERVSITVPRLRAGGWTVREDFFAVRADISNLLEQYGPGVYTVTVTYQSGGSTIPFSHQSIFYDVTPP